MSDRRDIVLPADQQELKGACRALVRSFGGQDAAASRLGTRQQRISDCINRSTDSFLRIDEIAVLEDETVGHPGHPHVTAARARQLGYELVRTPTITATGKDLLQLFARQSKENSDLAQAIVEAHADGTITGSEAERIESECDDIIATALAMRAEARLIRKEHSR
jgi:hypothetical protein